MLAELPAEHVPGPPPLASGVRHFAWLLRENTLQLIQINPKKIFYHVNMYHTCLTDENGMKITRDCFIFILMYKTKLGTSKWMLFTEMTC